MRFSRERNSAVDLTFHVDINDGVDPRNSGKYAECDVREATHHDLLLAYREAEVYPVAVSCWRYVANGEPSNLLPSSSPSPVTWADEQTGSLHPTVRRTQ